MLLNVALWTAVLGVPSVNHWPIKFSEHLHKLWLRVFPWVSVCGGLDIQWRILYFGVMSHTLNTPLFEMVQRCLAVVLVVIQEKDRSNRLTWSSQFSPPLSSGNTARLDVQVWVFTLRPVSPTQHPDVFLSIFSQMVTDLSRWSSQRQESSQTLTPYSGTLRHPSR